jgi:hypothetical protein
LEIEGEKEMSYDNRDSIFEGQDEEPEGDEEEFNNEYSDSTITTKEEILNDLDMVDYNSKLGKYEDFIYDYAIKSLVIRALLYIGDCIKEKK